MKSTKIMRRLRESFDVGRIVTVVRDEFEASMIEGLVIAITDEWAALHYLADLVHLDDVVLVRLCDVSRVGFRDDDAFHHRALEALGTPVATFDGAADATTADLLARAGGNGTIFGFSLEMHDGEPLQIGRLLRLRGKSFDFHFVGRDGVWAKEVDRWKYKHVTRIEIGGRYLDALNRFSDPYPGS